MQKYIAFLLILLLATTAPAATWSPLKIGAGGWVTGMEICADGTTAFARTDTYGAYVKDLTDNNSTWTQVIRSDTMPAALVDQYGDWINEGVYSLAVAPSDCNRLYMAYREKIYKSTDRGATWTDTAFSIAGTMEPNDSYRYWGEKMAVDPANPDVVYAGTIDNGMFRTLNGGTSWSVVADVATGGVQGITGIVFDNNSGTTGGKTNTIYATSNGTGVYQTTNAGDNWVLLAGSPATVRHAAVAVDNVYYSVNMTGAVHKYSDSSWSDSASNGTTYHSIAVDPFDAARIIAGADSGFLSVSTDRGATWLQHAGNGIIETVTRTATDIPWLAWTPETYMSNGAMRFDPVVQNKLWFTEGIGVWYSTAPDNATRTTWVSSSAGIEQLVGRDVIIPPGGNVVVVGMDRRGFYVDKANTTYPSTHGTEASPTNAIVHGWSVSYATDNASNIVGLVNYYGSLKKSGYSTDGGQSWTLFSTEPNGENWAPSGCIAATSLDNILIVQGHAGATAGWLWRSTDRGDSWTEATLPGATDNATEQANLHCGSTCKKHVLAVDRVNIHTVYLHFYGHGIYKSTDDGANWTLVSSQAFDSSNAYWHTRLRSVPGQAGHLFLTVGQAGGAGAANPASTHLWRSVDGGENWTSLDNVAEPYDVAFGKAAAGQSYPAIYFAGWYNNSWGIWRSNDNAATWELYGTYPLNSLDTINALAASQDVYGDVYVAFNGSGWGYGTEAAAEELTMPSFRWRSVNGGWK